MAQASAQAGILRKIKLILCDMDGTLLPFGEDRVSKRTMAAIHALQDQGVHFGPSSGRERDDLIKFFWGDVRCVDTGITANGKVVHLDGDLIFRRQLPRAALKKLVELIRPLEGVVMNFYTPTDEDPHKLVFGAIGKDKAGLEPIARYLGEPFAGGIHAKVPEELTTCALLLNLNVVDARALQAKIKECLPEFDLLLSAPHVLDVVEAGWSKASSLDLLLEALNVKPEEVLYFGDSHNDITMLERLPNSCCMANGVDEAKAAATWVIDSCEHDGVARVLEKLLENDLRLEADFCGA